MTKWQIKKTLAGSCNVLCVYATGESVRDSSEKKTFQLCSLDGNKTCLKASPLKSVDSVVVEAINLRPIKYQRGKNQDLSKWLN